MLKRSLFLALLFSIARLTEAQVPTDSLKDSVFILLSGPVLKNAFDGHQKEWIKRCNSSGTKCIIKGEYRKITGYITVDNNVRYIYGRKRHYRRVERYKK